MSLNYEKIKELERSLTAANTRESDLRDENVKLRERNKRQAERLAKCEFPEESELPLHVREAARIRTSLCGADAQALEHAVTITEQERDEALTRVKELESTVLYNRNLELVKENKELERKRDGAVKSCKLWSMDFEAARDAKEGLELSISGMNNENLHLQTEIVELNEEVNQLQKKNGDLLSELNTVKRQRGKYRREVQVLKSVGNATAKDFLEIAEIVGCEEFDNSRDIVGAVRAMKVDKVKEETADTNVAESYLEELEEMRGELQEIASITGLNKYSNSKDIISAVHSLKNLSETYRDELVEIEQMTDSGAVNTAGVVRDLIKEQDLLRITRKAFVEISNLVGGQHFISVLSVVSKVKTFLAERDEAKEACDLLSATLEIELDAKGKLEQKLEGTKQKRSEYPKDSDALLAAQKEYQETDNAEKATAGEHIIACHDYVTALEQVLADGMVERLGDGEALKQELKKVQAELDGLENKIIAHCEDCGCEECEDCVLENLAAELKEETIDEEGPLADLEEQMTSLSQKVDSVEERLDVQLRNIGTDLHTRIDKVVKDVSERFDCLKGEVKEQETPSDDK